MSRSKPELTSFSQDDIDAKRRLLLRTYFLRSIPTLVIGIAVMVWWLL